MHPRGPLADPGQAGPIRHASASSADRYQDEPGLTGPPPVKGRAGGLSPSPNDDNRSNECRSLPIAGQRTGTGEHPQGHRPGAGSRVGAIELDVQQADGELWVFHDRRLERCTDGHGVLSHQSRDYLASLDAGDGERIPTLWQVMSLDCGALRAAYRAQGCRHRRAGGRPDPAGRGGAWLHPGALGRLLLPSSRADTLPRCCGRRSELAP